MSNDDDHDAAFAAFMAAGDFRDSVAQACDNFAPTRREAIPLGAGTVFSEFTDTDGSVVTVRLSSASMRECCRVFIVPDASRGGNGDLHLCRCMAAELRRALDEAFDYTLDEQPSCSAQDEE